VLLVGATGSAGAQVYCVAGQLDTQQIQGIWATGASGSSIPSGLDMQTQYNDNV
jgi:ABC-type phosphate/phosphonate transport system permease subunit